jgi:hypothetical protein
MPNYLFIVLQGIATKDPLLHLIILNSLLFFIFQLEKIISNHE